ncbi:MAG: LCP family protein [Eubacteriales bacterium]|nr:LCP family protein [Eubacteriales bacterium]
MKKLLARVLALCCALLLLVPALPAAAEENGFSILLIGLDDGSDDNSEYGRADAMIIATLSSSGVRLVSIDRDLCVVLPEEYGIAAGETKLCITAYFGGPEMTLRYVNDALGLSIPYYAAIDKPGVVKLINAVGGLTLEIDDDDLAVKEVKKLFKSKGSKTLKGKSVLNYIGARTMDSTGDIDRNRRQRKVLAAAFEKARGMDFGQLAEAAGALMEVTQTNLDLAGLMSVASQAMSGVDSVRESRYPQTFQRKTLNLHSVVLPTDVEAERAQVHAFLYE